MAIDPGKQTFNETHTVFLALSKSTQVAYRHLVSRRTIGLITYYTSLPKCKLGKGQNSNKTAKSNFVSVMLNAKRTNWNDAKMQKSI